MFVLQGQGLEADILDPAADMDRLGSRYCSGGYIHQVRDRAKGDLFAGPFYPDPRPPVFDGQGLPEAFEIPLGAKEAKVGDLVLVLGVGLVRRTSDRKPFHVRNNPEVAERARWDVDFDPQAPSRISMRTRQAFPPVTAKAVTPLTPTEGWATAVAPSPASDSPGAAPVQTLELEREIRFEGRTLVSQTRVRNTGSGQLPLRWFAHPFFPLNADGSCFKPDLEVQAPASDAFRLDAQGFIATKREYDWKRGAFFPLSVTLGAPCRMETPHPLLGQVEVRCDFPLAYLPIWANACTFSYEPFHHTVLDPGAESRWSIRYLL